MPLKYDIDLSTHVLLSLLDGPFGLWEVNPTSIVEKRIKDEKGL